MSLGLFLGKKPSYKNKIDLKQKDLTKARDLIDILLKLAKNHPTITCKNSKAKNLDNVHHEIKHRRQKINLDSKLRELLAGSQEDPSQDYYLDNGSIHQDDDSKPISRNYDLVNRLMYQENDDKPISIDTVKQINTIINRTKEALWSYLDDILNQWVDGYDYEGLDNGETMLQGNITYASLMMIREQLRKKFHITKSGDAFDDTLEYHFPTGTSIAVQHFMLQPDCSGGKPFSAEECKELYGILKNIKIKDINDKGLNQQFKYILNALKQGAIQHRPMSWA